MASVAATSTGSSSSRWGGKSTDPESAFNGLSRGRPRGSGRGPSRGGRGGRGAARGGRPLPEPVSGRSEVTTANSNPPLTNKPNPVQSRMITVDDKASGPSQSATPRSKFASRRSTRDGPSLVIAPSSNPLFHLSDRSASRRKRSSTYNRSPIAPAELVTPTESPSVDIQSTHTITPDAAPVKDTPPHLGPSHETKTDIDALVERVRATAMAENRPSTPGSHIDWAGDDDDSLPDLNDWGFSTGASAEIVEEISPIFVDGLKPLPEPDLKQPPGAENRFVVSSAPDFPVNAGETDNPIKTLPKNSDSSAAADSETLSLYSQAPSSLSSISGGQCDASVSNPPLAVDNLSGAEMAVSPVSGRRLLHPSLPPKPVGLSDPQSNSFRSSRNAVPMRLNTPPKSTQTPSNDPKPIDAESIPSVLSLDASTPVVVKLPLPVSEAMALPDDSTKEMDSHYYESFGDGLAESIHAPRAPVVLPSPRTPSLALSDAGSFNPTHSRAHTLGRPSSFRLGSPTHGVPPRFSRSVASSPKNAFVPHHSRNHSSPPVNSSHRTPHTSRPVITGAAISRLARAIGTTVAPSGTGATRE